jgi:hypothetical protein
MEVKQRGNTVLGRTVSAENAGFVIRRRIKESTCRTGWLPGVSKSTN